MGRYSFGSFAPFSAATGVLEERDEWEFNNSLSQCEQWNRSFSSLRGFPQRVAQWWDTILLAMLPRPHHFAIYSSSTYVRTHAYILDWSFSKILLPRGKVSWSCDKFFTFLPHGRTLVFSFVQCWRAIYVKKGMAISDSDTNAGSSGHSKWPRAARDTSKHLVGYRPLWENKFPWLSAVGLLCQVRYNNLKAIVTQSVLNSRMIDTVYKYDIDYWTHMCF